MRAETQTAKPPDSDLRALPVEEREGIRLLIVEGDPALRDRLATAIRLEGYTATAVASGTEALASLERTPYDIVLTDLDVIPVGGLDVLHAARRAGRDTIVIVITANPSIATSIEAMRAGAWDYLTTPFSDAHLQVLIGRAAYAVLQTRAVRELRAQLDRRTGRGDTVELIGTSPAMSQAVQLARKVAVTEAPVLLVGETGTGKQHFAHFIHEHSRRAGHPFIPINCAVRPETLLESEVFGYSRTAFAVGERGKPGLLESAHGGTVFFDGLADMPVGLQAELVRVGREGLPRRTASNGSDAAVDVRFITGVTGDPNRAVADGLLREDLLNELRGFSIRVPPLRERREDIPLLAGHFLTSAWRRHGAPGTPTPTLTPGSLGVLVAQPWRGNVRELRSVMEHVAILAEEGQEIEPQHIPITHDTGPQGLDFNATLLRGVLQEPFHDAKERLVGEFERVYLRQLVDRTGGNLALAARLANIDRTTLYRLLDKHNLGVRRVPIVAARA